ncbi:hypothetical protein RMR10_010085 [Agrobacterium rosae]|uniref:hypothetical protein n=1 Tax=Agrobacterium rosae TaxID=1972867 RepID=UPI002A12997B|nr:hypothetical protein [Agrobacterium rosae]MDX8312970.1 hypothetical protein [Agrobacterium rosae]
MKPVEQSLKADLENLTLIFDDAEELGPDEHFEIDAPIAKTLLKSLRLITKRAGAMEIELMILRDSEAGKALTSAVESLATHQLTKLLDAAGSNVVHPDFGGKKHDR